MQPEKQRIITYFIEEARDHLDTIEQGLLDWRNTIENPEVIQEMFLAARAIQGGAAMLNFRGIQKIAKFIEKYFQEIQKYPLSADGEVEILLRQIFSALKELLVQLSGNLNLNNELVNKVMLVVEPAEKELERRLKVLTSRVEQMRSRITIKARNEGEYLSLTGKSTLQAISQAIAQVGGTITRRHWQPNEGGELDLGIEVQMPDFLNLEEIPKAIASTGGTIDNFHLEVLRTCRQCYYYHGHSDVVCALHPDGPEEEFCRDWESRKERTKGQKEWF
jgi:chemotaxis protein histidine kinase CheA